MRAAAYDTSGPERGKLRTIWVPDPVPEAGEVRVRVHVSGVNPTDWKAREQLAQAVSWSEQIPNQDGAGVIDAVGEGVDPSRVGERVWVYHAAADRPGGSAAQYVCLPESQAVVLPDGVTYDQGAGLGIPGITAHRCVFADGDVRGRTVLVTGGAGAVGHAAIQLARRGGARVIATVSTDEKAVLAEQAGADDVLRYGQPGFEEELRSVAPDGLDRVVDVALATNLHSYVSVLADHAVVSCYSRQPNELEVEIKPLLRGNVVLRFVYVYGLPPSALRAATTDLTAALVEGALQPLPTHRFPLEEIDDAHEAVRGGVTGKVLVDIP